MTAVSFKRARLTDWRFVEGLEKGAASPFFCQCDGEEGYKKYIKESKVFFIMNNRTAIGTISYKREKATGTMFINGLTILPRYRGKGIATKAMKKLLTVLRNKNVALFVHPENTPALLIYLRLGFVIKEWKDNHFGNGQPRLYLWKSSE